MTTRQNWFPPVSAQPTPEEMARHLRLIFTALNQHDSAINMLNGKIATTTPQSSATAINSLAQPASSGLVMAPPKKGVRKFSLP